MIGGEKSDCPLAVDYFVSRVNPLFTDIIGHIDHRFVATEKISIREIVIEKGNRISYTNADHTNNLDNLHYKGFQFGNHWDTFSKSKVYQMEVDNNRTQLTRPRASLLRVHLNRNFVTDITVPGVKIKVDNMSVNKELERSFEESSVASTDSDSLHVDEELFNSGYFPSDTEVPDMSSVEVSQPEMEVNNVLSSSSSSSYDPVKDLYEILSNSKERLVVTQALKGTYQEPLLRSWMESHVASISNSSYSRIGGLSSSSSSAYQVAPPLPDRIPRTAQQTSANSKDARILQVSDIISNSPVTGEERGTTSSNVQDRNAKVANVNSGHCSRLQKWWQPLQNYFHIKRNADTAKIIATTVLGLVAFGVITALSLGINRV